MKKHHPNSSGSTLIVAMIVVAITSAMIAAYYETLIPKYRSAFHAADWHEALHGAEAGVDLVVQKLNQNAVTTPSPDAYDWTGWTLDSSHPLNGARTLDSAVSLGGPEALTVSSVTVDVYTRDTSQASSPSYDPWFRVRSTARANLPERYMSLDKRDAVLRRMALTAKNGLLEDPHVSRTVEVILKPSYRFTNAIVTMQSLSLGNSANWKVDSFDSSSTSKSDPGTTAGGVYPASASKIQSNGDIATLNSEPAGTVYGPLIVGNGAGVAGDVSTKGGDDPTTVAHENVSGSGGMDQTRIFDNFDQDLPVVPAPTWSSFLASPVGNTGFSTGTKAAPDRYIVNGTLGTFSVIAPSSGTGYVEILVNGNLSTGNGNGAGITIPPNVVATIYVTGNIDFGNGNINTNSSSSQVASHLTVYGTAASGTYTASGNANQTLSFYGPGYAITMNGTVTTVGAMVGKSFSISGGGNGGFHYDEALGKGGAIAGWTVASYFDDARVDPQ